MSSGFIRDQHQLLDRQLALKSNANQNSEDYVFNFVKIRPKSQKYRKRPRF